MKRAGFAALLLLVLAAPLAAAELAMRWIGLGDPVLYYSTASYRYAPVPNQRRERRNDAAVTIDDHGLRGPEPWSAKGDRHLLFLGDSVTWGGTNTDDRETFAARTCMKLEERGSGNLVCGNAGVNGYGVDNITARLRYDPVVQTADAIIVTLITVDGTRGLTDLRSSYFYSAQPHGPFKALWELGGFMMFYGAGKLRYDRNAYDSRDDLTILGESLARLFDALHHLQQRGKQVLLVFSPIESELETESALSMAMRSSLRMSGLPSLDLTQPMVARRQQRLYFDGVHLSPTAHDLYATWISDQLDGHPRQQPATASMIDG